MPAPRRRLLIGCACLALALVPATTRADLIWDVNLDTSALASDPGSGPYALAFTLYAGVVTSNTTATLNELRL